MKHDLPPDDAATTVWVEYGEQRAGETFRDELAGYFDLACAVVDAAGPLVERISEQPGEARSIHAAALLLSRVISDLAACMYLLRAGYAAQAITLVGTMLEVSHVMAYIGADESRAREWASWDKPTKTYPGPLLEVIKANSVAMGADSATAQREYEVLYRSICQIKHGNTLAIHLPNSAVFGDLQCFVIGPLVSEPFIRLGHAAAQWATRYAILAETAFIHFHVAKDQSYETLARQNRLAEQHAALVKNSIQRFAGDAT